MYRDFRFIHPYFIGKKVKKSKNIGIEYSYKGEVISCLIKKYFSTYAHPYHKLMVLLI